MSSKVLCGSAKDVADEPEQKQALGACCPPGAFPQLEPPKDYKPAGKFITYGNKTRAYVTGDPQWGSGIIVMHDVYGAESGYHAGVCDAFARGGYYVVMIDFYEFVGGVDNYWSKGDTDGGATFLKKFSWDFCKAKIEDTLKHLEELKIDRIGSLGFCWGAWIVARATATFPDKIKAGVWYHPSLWVDAKLFGGEDEKAITEKINVPTYFAPSQDEKRDFWDYKIGMKILQDKGVPTEYTEFSRMHHGWMTRGAGGMGISFIQAGGSEMDVTTSQDVNRGICVGLGFFAKYLYLDTDKTPKAE